MGEITSSCKSFTRKIEGKRQPEDLDIDGKIILAWILGKYSGEVWSGCIWLRIRTSRGLL
jgi:hypothetical protein